MTQLILIIEDERKLAFGLQTYLENEGFQAMSAADGATGLLLARRERPDLILLDLMLSGIDGIEVCRTLRAESRVPIIMLTARVEEADTLLGFDVGADDYITKPFSPRQVVARVRAVLRRAAGELQGLEVLRAASVELDLQRRSVSVGGAAIDGLTPTEFDLLAALMRNAGRPLTRSVLLDAIQSHSSEAYDRTVDAHIKNLRRKIEPDPAQPRYVLTVFGVGYKFVDAL